MSRTWTRPDLTGTRNGANTSFTIPSLPDGAAVWLIFNGRVLFQVALTPNPLQYTRTGNAVVVGLAPQASDTLWAYVVSEEEQAPTTAVVLIQELRRTFYYNVEVRDKAGLLQEIIEKDISATRWSYYPIGGCGEAEIVLRRPFDDFGQHIQLDYGIEIWREIDILGQAGARLPAELPIRLGTAHAGNRELRWGGFIREIERVLSDDEQVIVRCAGWSRQLAYIFIDNDTPWTNMDVGAIVRDIITRFVVPGSQITLGTVPDTGIIVDSINFDTTAWDAINVLAQIAGNAEWGVTPSKSFYFIQPIANTARQTHVIEDRITMFRPQTNTDEIVKTVYLRGANGFKAVLNNGTPEAGYYKQRREFVAGIQSAQVAALWGVAYFAKYGDTLPSGQLQLGQTDEWIENVGHPLGLLRVIGSPVFLGGGSPLPAELPVGLANMYGKYTDEKFRIASISYQAADDALTIDIGLGQRRRAQADIFDTINYKLAELQQAQGL